MLYNTFIDMPGTRAFGRPKGEDHLLQPGELSASLHPSPGPDVPAAMNNADGQGRRPVIAPSGWFAPEMGFRVLSDKVEVEAQFGRELSLFLACLDKLGP